MISDCGGIKELVISRKVIHLKGCFRYFLIIHDTFCATYSATLLWEEVALVLSWECGIELSEAWESFFCSSGANHPQPHKGYVRSLRYFAGVPGYLTSRVPPPMGLDMETIVGPNSNTFYGGVPPAAQIQPLIPLQGI